MNRTVSVKVFCPKQRQVLFNVSIDVARLEDGKMGYVPYGCPGNNESEECVHCMLKLFHRFYDQQKDPTADQIIEIPSSVPKKS